MQTTVWQSMICFPFSILPAPTSGKIQGSTIVEEDFFSGFGFSKEHFLIIMASQGRSDAIPFKIKFEKNVIKINQDFPIPFALWKN
jgi:hypothetical protein